MISGLSFVCLTIVALLLIVIYSEDEIFLILSSAAGQTVLFWRETSDSCRHFTTISRQNDSPSRAVSRAFSVYQKLSETSMERSGRSRTYLKDCF